MNCLSFVQLLIIRHQYLIDNIMATSRTFIFYCFCLLLALAIAANCQGQAAQHSFTQIKLIGETGSDATIQFEMGQFQQQSVATPAGEAMIIRIDEGTPMLQKGFPDLPKLTASLIIPDDKNMEVTVTAADYVTYENILIAPSKGSLLRDVNPEEVPFVFDSVYTVDEFFPKEITALREPYILRDYRAQTVIVYPFQYNAVTKSLRVYQQITVKLTSNSEPAMNALKRNPVIDDRRNAAFNLMYSRQFINYEHDTRYDQLGEEGNMLIICHGPFMEAMKPFVDWKIQRGLPVEMVDVASIGNNKTAIRNFVTNYYNTKGLAYLLLVGDAAQVATSSTGAGDSDNDYGYITGEDHYQEIFVGRFSAETEADVMTQVSKSVAYEKSPPADFYFSKGVCIASDEGAGAGDDGEADFEHQDLIRTQLLNYAYADVQELFDGTHGNTDAPGNPVADDLSDLLNDGTGLVSYTGHGNGSSLSTTDFDVADAENLTNTGKWPFIWVVGCSVGNFTGATCLAEAFARSSHNGEAAGAIASFMSTILQAWAEPMEAQDEITAILTESYADNIKRTFGGLSINGCFSMNDKYGNTGFNMTDTWTLFGDPSLEIRTAQPAAMVTDHDAVIMMGSTHFPVQCNAEQAVACLSVNGNILSTATVTGGIADLYYPQITTDDTVLLTITGYNLLPHIVTLPAVQPSGPFVISSQVTITDDAGNGNGLADYGEDLLLHVTLKNIGLSGAEALTVTLSTLDPYVAITNPGADWPLLESNDSILLPGAFALTVAANVPDGQTALLSCKISDNASNTWITPLSITLHAPVLAVSAVMIDDMAGGNGDGYLDPSETAIITITTGNQGHSDAMNVITSLFSSSGFIDISNQSFSIGNLPAGDSTLVQFDVSVAPDATFGLDVPFTAQVNAWPYVENLDFSAVISPAIEDFETGDFTTHDWQLSGTANWFITGINAYEGDQCAMSGDVGNNQSSTLEIILDVQFDDDLSFAHKVSSEAGYDFLKFFIDGVLQNKWSGETDWMIASYTIDSGSHSLRWEYSKDGYFSEGADAAWLDQMMLPAYEVNTATGVATVATAVSLQASPNPFKNLTQISYYLSKPSLVSMKLYDAHGRLVRQFMNDRPQQAGNHVIAFDGSDMQAGIYLCKMVINGKSATTRLVHIE